MFIQVGEDIGQTFKIGQRSKQYLEQAGFVNVAEKKFKLPVGSWMEHNKWKEIGRWNLYFLLEGLDGMQLLILKTILGVSFLMPFSDIS